MIGLGFEPRPSAINLVLLHTSLCPSSKPPCEKCGQTFPLHREGNQGPERSRNSPKVMRQEVTELELGLRPVCPVLSSELVSTVPRTLPQANPSQSQVSPDKRFLFIFCLQTGLWGGVGGGREILSLKFFLLPHPRAFLAGKYSQTCGVTHVGRGSRASKTLSINLGPSVWAPP